MAPADDPDSGDEAIGIFGNVHRDFRVMTWPGYEYVLGTNRARSQIRADLPAGTWRVTRYDAIDMRWEVLRAGASGQFTFDSPDSRAVLFHFREVNQQDRRSDSSNTRD